MKSFVQSMYLLTNAFGSALSEGLNPVSKDPQVQWLYVGVCIACAITAVVFWVLFHHLNAQEEALNELTKNEPMLKRGSISGGYVEEGQAEKVL
jgi:POT family proton-dependent oligopeptide transporter